MSKSNGSFIVIISFWPIVQHLYLHQWVILGVDNGKKLGGYTMDLGTGWSGSTFRNWKCGGLSLPSWKSSFFFGVNHGIHPLNSSNISPKHSTSQADWLCNPSTCRSNYTAAPKMKVCVEISFLAIDDPKYIIEHKRVNRTSAYLHTYNIMYIYIWKIYIINIYIYYNMLNFMKFEDWTRNPLPHLGLGCS